MFVFSKETTKKSLTEWGVAIKKRLIDLRMSQDELVAALTNKGFTINKVALSNLLYGVGIKNRMPEILAINEILEIQSKGTPK